jgi:AraC-like DNA-binding protein
MSFSPVNILSIVIIFQLLLLVLFLVASERGKRSSNILLSAFFLLLLFNISDGLLSYYGFYVQNPELAHLEDGFVFLLGPILYFYTRSVIFRDFKLHRSDFSHLVPFFVVTIAFLSLYHFQAEAYQKMIQESIMHQTLPRAFYISTVVIYGHVGTYIFFAFKDLRKYRNEIKRQFSSISKINLEWLTFLLGSVVAVLAISLIYTFLPIAGLSAYFEMGFTIAFVFLFAFINAIVWRAMKQPQIFAGISISEKVSTANPEVSTSNEQLPNSLVVALGEKMEREKLFLNPDLSLDGLATALNVSPKKLSQLLNEKFKQNFFEYINSYRIREAQQIFEKNPDPKLTVLEVMYECGFNSKSSFNTIFKSKTGSTPSEYKRKHQLQ